MLLSLSFFLSSSFFLLYFSSFLWVQDFEDKTFHFGNLSRDFLSLFLPGTTLSPASNHSPPTTTHRVYL